jgi:TolB-like protein/DNA-binding winged helix-turn-helix (wHTH) protein
MTEPRADASKAPTPPRRTGDLVIDAARAVVTRDGTEIALPKLSFDLLLALVDRAPALVSIDELMRVVWPKLVVSPETVSQRVKLLRDALGDDPKQPRYVLGVRGRGYRWLAEPVPVVAATPAPVPRQSNRRVAYAIAAAVVAVTAIALWRWQPNVQDASSLGADGATVPVATERSVAVLPFDNLGGLPEGEAVALGVADSVLHQLANLRELRVIARSSSFALQGRQIDARDLGRRLGARYLVTGTVQSDPKHLRVTASLVDSTDGSQLWSMRFDRPPGDIFAIQDEIAERVAGALRISLDAGAAERIAGKGTRVFDAYLAYLQGSALLASARVPDMKAAVDHLSRAVRIDPQFAAAYVALAQAELGVAEYEVTDSRDSRFDAALRRSLDLVARALELDPASGAAHIERAYLRAFTDLPAAEADYRRGLELSPNSARGYAGLAAVLFEHPDRFPESLPMIDRARRLDPLQPAYDVTKSVYLLYGRSDVEAADQQLVDVLKREPLYQPALSHLGELRWCCEGRFADAIRYSEEALRLDPLSTWTRRQLLRAYLDVGDAAAARRTADGDRASLPALRVPLLLYARDWRAAGDAAYAAVATETVAPIDCGIAVAAIRKHARASGGLERASLTLGLMAGVTWDKDGNPTLPDRYSLLEPAVGLGDLLIASGQPRMGRRLLETVLERMDLESRARGRGEMWYFQQRPIALALLGRNDEALAQLEKAVEQGYGYHDAWFYLDHDPAFDALRREPRFKTLRQKVAGRVAAERALVERQRAAELAPAAAQP